MKLNRKHLRKMILQEMKNEVPPHLRVDDAFPPKRGSTRAALNIVENMVEEIEGSHGGLGLETNEAAEELIRRLDEAGGFDVPELIAELLLDCMLELRSITRR